MTTTTPSARPLTDAEVEVLRHYGRGAQVDAIAKMTRLNHDRINSIVSTRASMNRQHAAELVRRHDAEVRREKVSQPLPLPDQSPAAPPPPSTVDAILAAGEAHELKSIRDRAIRIRALVDTLKVQLRQADKDRQAAAAQARAREEAIARVAQLEQELAEARAALRPAVARASRQSVAANSESQQARAWAARNDVPCNARGRVPGSVLDAYRAALAAGPGRSGG